MHIHNSKEQDLIDGFLVHLLSRNNSLCGNLVKSCFQFYKNESLMMRIFALNTMQVLFILAVCLILPNAVNSWSVLIETWSNKNKCCDFFFRK